MNARSKVASQSVRVSLGLVAFTVCCSIGVASALLDKASAESPSYSKVSSEVFGELKSSELVPVVVTLVGDPIMPDADNLLSRKATLAETVESVLQAVSPEDFTLERKYKSLPAISGAATGSGILALAALDEVEHVGLNHELRPDLVEAASLIRADLTHSDLGVTGEGVVIAVLDTGVDTDHPLLAGDINHQACLLEVAECPAGDVTSAEDFDGHGTHVTGIITSSGPPVGIAPDAKIDAFKVMGDTGPTSFIATILAAYDEIITSHPEVNLITMSIGTNASHPAGSCEIISPALTSAVAAVRTMGVLTFVSAGNGGGKDGLSYPACLSDVVSVGAVYDANFGLRNWGGCTDANALAGEVVCFSQSDGSLDLLAPGSEIVSTWLGGGLMPASGTSMAAPAAAAVAALVLESEPLLSPASLLARIKDRGVPVTDAANGITSCRVDAYAAVSNTGGQTCVPIVPPTPTASPTATCPPGGCPTATPTLTPTPCPAACPTIDITGSWNLSLDGDLVTACSAEVIQDQTHMSVEAECDRIGTASFEGPIDPHEGVFHITGLLDAIPDFTITIDGVATNNGILSAIWIIADLDLSGTMAGIFKGGVPPPVGGISLDGELLGLSSESQRRTVWPAQVTAAAAYLLIVSPLLGLVAWGSWSRLRRRVNSR